MVVRVQGVEIRCFMQTGVEYLGDNGNVLDDVCGDTHLLKLT